VPLRAVLGRKVAVNISFFFAVVSTIVIGSRNVVAFFILVLAVVVRRRLRHPNQPPRKLALGT